MLLRVFRFGANAAILAPSLPANWRDALVLFFNFP